MKDYLCSFVVIELCIVQMSTRALFSIAFQHFCSQGCSRQFPILFYGCFCCHGNSLPSNNLTHTHKGYFSIFFIYKIFKTIHSILKQGLEKNAQYLTKQNEVCPPTHPSLVMCGLNDTIGDPGEIMDVWFRYPF